MLVSASLPQKILRGAEGTFVDLASHYELTGPLGSVDCANSKPLFADLMTSPN